MGLLFDGGYLGDISAPFGLTLTRGALATITDGDTATTAVCTLNAGNLQGTATFSLLSETVAGLQVNSSTGAVTLDDTAVWGTNPSATFKVVDDADSSEATLNITVTVQPSAIGALVFTPSSDTVNENAQVLVSVLTLASKNGDIATPAIVSGGTGYELLNQTADQVELWTASGGRPVGVDTVGCRVYDDSGQSSSGTIPVTVQAVDPLVLTYVATLTELDASTAYTAEVLGTFTATGGTSPYVIQNDSSSSGVTITDNGNGTATATYTGTTGAAGSTLTVAAQATSAAGSAIAGDEETVDIVATAPAFTGQFIEKDAGNNWIVNTWTAGTLTHSGSGQEFYAAGDDSLAFQYLTAAGNFDFICKIESVPSTRFDTSYFGIMARLGLDNDSAYAATTAESAGTRLWRLRFRLTSGGSPSYEEENSVRWEAEPWMRLTRVGTVYNSYSSANGSTWVQIGSRAISVMTGSVYVGLFTCARTDTAGDPVTVVYSNFDVTGAV